MGFWNTWKYDDIVKFLKLNGFQEDTYNKHPKWTDGERSFIIINKHTNGKDVWVRILKQIIKDSEIPEKEWEKWKKKEKF